MDITYLGHSSFKLKGRKASVVTDPFDPSGVGLKFSGISADIVTISHDHADHNRADLVGDSPFVIKGPGEYEIADISVIGFPTFHDDKKGEERGSNTVYVYEIDDLRISHLGDLGHKLSEKLVEDLGDIDILLIPIGGYYTIDANVAGEVVRAIEPSIVIPMHFKFQGINETIFGKLASVEEFTKELGLPRENLPKLSIKKAEMGDDQKVIVLDIKA